MFSQYVSFNYSCSYANYVLSKQALTIFVCVFVVFLSLLKHASPNCLYIIQLHEMFTIWSNYIQLTIIHAKYNILPHVILTFAVVPNKIMFACACVSTLAVKIADSSMCTRI